MGLSILNWSNLALSLSFFILFFAVLPISYLFIPNESNKPAFLSNVSFWVTTPLFEEQLSTSLFEGPDWLFEGPGITWLLVLL